LELGAERALVVHGADGMDEISSSGPTSVAEVASGEISEYQISPKDFDLAVHPPDAILGGDAHTNARILRDVLSGDEMGAPRDVILINAAAAILVSGSVSTLEGGLKAAKTSLDDGAAEAALETFIKTTRRLSGTA
jgi:anthranilate phosphoribosyltransferase